MRLRSALGMYSADGKVDIELVFALPERQHMMSLSVDSETTVEMAISLSKIGQSFPDEDLMSYQAGVWGKPVNRDYLLQDGDRLELYRPLAMDPREARRQLAASGRSMGGSNPKDPD